MDKLNTYQLVIQATFYLYQNKINMTHLEKKNVMPFPIEVTQYKNITFIFSTTLFLPCIYRYRCCKKKYCEHCHTMISTKS